MSFVRGNGIFGRVLIHNAIPIKIKIQESLRKAGKQEKTFEISVFKLHAFLLSLFKLTLFWVSILLKETKKRYNAP
jgi:hypothetical protein